MLAGVRAIGYDYDREQSLSAARKHGRSKESPHMSSRAADLQPSYKVANAALNVFPYPHFFVQDIFDGEYYAQIQANLPDSNDMLPIEKVRPVRGYDERFVFELKGKQLERLPSAKQAFWRDLQAWLVGGRFGQIILNKFAPFMEQRFGNAEVSLYDDAMLVQDVTNYALGPHTDAQRKVVTMLFYLPRDTSQTHLGTSIYVPKQATFRCAGGPHYPHEGFERLWTMPFLPNSLFAFFKTDNSFHGVERVADPDTRRWLLLYDMYVEEKLASAAPAPRAGGNFS
jgi:hypothetical protein